MARPRSFDSGIEQNVCCVETGKTPYFVFAFFDLSRLATLDHNENIVRVPILKQGVSTGILPDFKVIYCLF